MPINHAFVSAKSDGGDATLVRPSDWNEDHDIDYVDIPEAAAPGTPATGNVRLYAKTDGNLYQKDDAGTETGLAGGGSGAPTDAQYIVGSANGTLSAEKVKAAIYDNYDPDEYPAGAAVATEFDGGALDSGWAWGTAPTTEDYTTYPGYGYFVHSTGNHWLSKAWTPGATDLTVAAKLLVARPVTNSTDSPAIMLGVSDATGTDPSNSVLLALFIKQGSDSTFEPYNRNTGSYAAIGSGARALGVLMNHSPIWLRLTRTNSGPTWNFYYSFNGLTWTEFASTGSKSLTVGAISLRLADQANVVAVDWIRAWSSIVAKVGV